MSLFTIARTDSVVGRKLVKRLLARGDQLLDPRALDHAAKIVDDVRARGDRAVRQAVRKFDGVATKDVATLCRRPMRVRGNELPPGFEAALERAILAVERYHRPQRRDGYRLDEDGIELRERRRPLKRVACYVPGGRAAYPSSVVMTVVPARLAGVPEIVVATPPGSYQRNAALRHTLARLGIEEVWTFGGAHAVAALAYGTESVPRVDKIVGPGNQWVTAAKYLTSSSVAIDGLAGPSEVVIVAGGDVDPAWIAADLLAQAEHDPLATALLITDDRSLARAVRREVSIQLRSLATASTARESLRNNGGALLVERMDDALDLLERLAPEHLQLVGAAAERLAERVSTAGAVFVGAHTPEVFGDYIAGPSHVLPTGGSARYASALGVEDFVRRSHVIRFDPVAATRFAAAAATLADVEGLPAHAAAARRRMEPLPRTGVSPEGNGG